MLSSLLFPPFSSYSCTRILLLPVPTAFFFLFMFLRSPLAHSSSSSSSYGLLLPLLVRLPLPMMLLLPVTIRVHGCSLQFFFIRFSHRYDSSSLCPTKKNDIFLEKPHTNHQSVWVIRIGNSYTDC